MADLTTTFLGLPLRSPLVVSSNPLCASIQNLKRMEAAGAGAAILPSLFEEQLTLKDLNLDYYVGEGADALPSSLRHAPDMTIHNKGADGYFAHVYQARRQTSMPIIASLNGSTDGGWVRYAQMLEGVGASALELNIYDVQANPHLNGSAVEEAYLRLVDGVKRRVSIPVAVKLNPYFSALPHLIRRLVEAGADGVVLFNRFYQPDIDLETETVLPNLQLSSSAELRLRLRWVAILYGHLSAEMAITGGVHTGEDALKSLLAGAQVAMMASALLKRGIGHIERTLQEMASWMDAHAYASVADLRGRLSQRHVSDPAAFERANYVQVLNSYKQDES